MIYKILCHVVVKINEHEKSVHFNLEKINSYSEDDALSKAKFKSEKMFYGKNYTSEYKVLGAEFNEDSVSNIKQPFKPPVILG